MKQLIDELANLKLAIFDLDGVIYRGHELISGADQVVQDLKDLSIKVIYNSNNSTVTRQMYVERLEKMGIPCEISDFYTSASITATEITKIKNRAKIFVIGDVGIREELKALGHDIIKNEAQYNQVDFVIAGLDVKFNYNKLRLAQKCILQGHAEFYATNPDTTLPMPGGLWPGAGVMVNAIQTCTGKAPKKIFGKPEPDGILLALEDFKIEPENACIFGDRLDTDIWAGNRASIKTACALTGVTTKEMIQDLENVKKGAASYNPEKIPTVILTRLEDMFS